MVFCGELLAIYSDEVERSRYLFLLNRSLGDAYLYDNFQYHLVIFQQSSNLNGWIVQSNALIPEFVPISESTDSSMRNLY